jgi:minichromosome maintenance protein 10
MENPLTFRRKRQLSHSLLQAHLDARYYLSPSLLYSVIRLSRDSKSYDVPVEGDWVTIAVVAERSEVRTTSGDPSFGSKQENDTEDVLMSDEEVKPLVDTYGNAKRGAKPAKKKKFISMTLCSLPPRTKSSKGFTGGGDALLKLLLFEAETMTKAPDGSRQYKGGSGGAFEKWSTLTVGSIIAILNPRVLRPLKVSFTHWPI